MQECVLKIASVSCVLNAHTRDENIAAVRVAVLLQVEAVTVYYWKQLREGHRVAQGFPAFISVTSFGHIYGLPAYEYPDHCKV